LQVLKVIRNAIYLGFLTQFIVRLVAHVAFERQEALARDDDREAAMMPTKGWAPCGRVRVGRRSGGGRRSGMDSGWIAVVAIGSFAFGCYSAGWRQTLRATLYVALVFWPVGGLLWWLRRAPEPPAPTITCAPHPTLEGYEVCGQTPLVLSARAMTPALGYKTRQHPIDDRGPPSRSS
jgi:hypothetical protein